MAPSEPLPLDVARQRQHKLRNLAQSVLLLGGMVGLLAFCAWLIAGGEGVLWGLFAGGMSLLFAPRLSPRVILAMYRAEPLTRFQVPRLVALVEELGRRAGLPRPPRVYYVPSPVLNAFAVGNRKDAAIAVTDGMLRRLTLREFAGVLAHEISHIRNNDLWVMNLADLVSRLTSFMAYAGIMLLFLNLPLLFAAGAGVPWLLVALLIVAPAVGSLLQLALSRAREFDADLDAAGITGDAAGLAQALRKLERQRLGPWERILMPGRRNPEPSLLRTHPTTEERVERLLALYPQAPRQAYPDDAFIALPLSPLASARAPRHRIGGLWY